MSVIHTYILIILVLSGNSFSVNGYSAIHSMEFNDKSSCERAKSLLQKVEPKESINIICVEKGMGDKI